MGLFSPFMYQLRATLVLLWSSTALSSAFIPHSTSQRERVFLFRDALYIRLLTAHIQHNLLLTVNRHKKQLSIPLSALLQSDYLLSLIQDQLRSRQTAPSQRRNRALLNDDHTKDIIKLIHSVYKLSPLNNSSEVALTEKLLSLNTSFSVDPSTLAFKPQSREKCPACSDEVSLASISTSISFDDADDNDLVTVPPSINQMVCSNKHCYPRSLSTLIIIDSPVTGYCLTCCSHISTSADPYEISNHVCPVCHHQLCHRSN